MPHIDLALTPFEAHMPDLLRVAAAAESHGINGLWIADHFSGAVVGRRWSRDPFVTLGALASLTDRVRIGPLVANIRNRHPSQLVSAINSLVSLAPGRVVLGVGSGAAPGSPFAIEHEAIGTPLGGAAYRRSLLTKYIRAVREMHEPSSDDRLLITDGAPCPPIIVGASAQATVDIAVEHADGVNLRMGPATLDLVRRSRLARGADFEISVLVWSNTSASLLGSLADAGVDRLVIGVPVGCDAAGAADAVERTRDATAHRSSAGGE